VNKFDNCTVVVDNYTVVSV